MVQINTAMGPQELNVSSLALTILVNRANLTGGILNKQQVSNAFAIAREFMEEEKKVQAERSAHISDTFPKNQQWINMGEIAQRGISELSITQIASLQGHLKAGNKIMAIKEFRTMKDCGLKEAKDAMDYAVESLHWEMGQWPR